MKNAITPWTQPLMDLFYRALGDEEPEVQCNAAFASGLLIEHSEVDLSPQYLQILSALRPMFVVAPDAPSAKLNARDNAVGARAAEVFQRCYDAGVLLRYTGDIIAISPPLIINETQIGEIFDVLGQAIRATA